MLPTVSANISFLNAEVGYPDLGISDDLFVVPDDFSLVHKI